MLAKHPLINPGFSGWNDRLCQTTNAVHATGQEHAMPVNRGGFRQAVCDINAHPVTLDNFQRWPVNLSVITPATRFQSWCKLMLNWFGNKVKYFDAINHSERERRSIRCDHRVIVRIRQAGFLPTDV